MSEHWHQQLSRASEGFGSVSVSRSYLRSALDRILELETALTDARRENDAMAALSERMAGFVASAIEAHCEGCWWADADMEDALLSCGFLEEVVVQRPCGSESCECSEGVACCRVTAHGRAALALDDAYRSRAKEKNDPSS